MKTIVVSFVIAAVCLTAMAGKNSYQYVITDSDTLICKNIRPGFINTKCILPSGEKKIISNEDINVISKTTARGKMVYYIEKKPVYLDNEYTGMNALMELVDVQNGLSVYKYEYYNSNAESVDLVVSFYKKDKLINTQTNPTIWKVNDFANQYANKIENKEFLTSK